MTGGTMSYWKWTRWSNAEVHFQGGVWTCKSKFSSRKWTPPVSNMTPSSLTTQDLHFVRFGMQYVCNFGHNQYDTYMYIVFPNLGHWCRYTWTEITYDIHDVFFLQLHVAWGRWVPNFMPSFSDPPQLNFTTEIYYEPVYEYPGILKWLV